MLRNTALALAAASLLLGAGALTPAFANYSQCDEQPNAEGCPTYAAPVPNGRAVIGRAYSRREAAHVTSRKLGSPFTAAHGKRRSNRNEPVRYPLHPSLSRGGMEAAWPRRVSQHCQAATAAPPG